MEAIKCKGLIKCTLTFIGSALHYCYWGTVLLIYYNHFLTVTFATIPAALGI